MNKVIERLTYKGRKKRLISDSIFIAAELFICVAAFCYIVKMGVLPDRYVVMLGVSLAAAVLISCLLNMFKYSHIPGKVLSVLVSALLIAVCFYGHHAMKMLENISTENYDVDTYILVVKKDSGINEAADLKGKNVGVVKSMNNAEAVNKALEELKTRGKVTFSVNEYEGMGQLVKALYNDSEDAILYNASFDSIIEEAIDTYADSVRVIESIEVRTLIEDKQENADKEANAKPTEEPGTEPPKEEETRKENDDLSNPEYVYDPSRDPNTPGGGGYIGGDNTVDNASKGPITDRCFNILISGIDAYGSLAGRSRSDVNILVTVNPKTKQIVLTNTPRDYYVPIPGVTYGDWRDKLTHAGNYGVWTSVATIENIYGVSIDYYARINFTSFVNIVNALGSFEVYSDYEFSVGGYNFVQGYNTITSGTQALCFARERHAFAAGDHQRGRNQMALIEAMINKCISPTVLPNFLNLVNTLSDCVQTNMTMDEITSMVKMQLNDGAKWTITRQSVGGSGGTRECFSMQGWDLSVVLPDQDSINAAKEVIWSVLQ